MPSQGNVRTRRPVKLRYCFGDDRPARRIRRVRPPILRPSSCEGGGVFDAYKALSRAFPRAPLIATATRLTAFGGYNLTMLWTVAVMWYCASYQIRCRITSVATVGKWSRGNSFLPERVAGTGKSIPSIRSMTKNGTTPTEARRRASPQRWLGATMSDPAAPRTSCCAAP